MKGAKAEVTATACLKAQKWFLGVGGAKKINFFLEIFFLGHTYSMTTEFTWTNCESHLNWKELDKSFQFFIYFRFFTPDFGIKCQFYNLFSHARIFVQLDSSNMMTEPPKYEVSYSWTFSTVPPTTVKTFTFLCHGFSHDNIHGFTHAMSFPMQIRHSGCHGFSHGNELIMMLMVTVTMLAMTILTMTMIMLVIFANWGAAANISTESQWDSLPFLSGISSATCFTN